jgi:hypothetical protein
VNEATSPLVAAYLADLDRALAGADPSDRLEIVDAVREHIDAELGASPSQAEVAAVLRRLGTADDVAAAWAVGAERRAAPAAFGPPATLLRPTAHGLQPVPPEEAMRRPTSPWLIALVVIVGLAFGLPLVLALLGALVLIPVRGGVPGWVDVVVGLVIGGATIACGVAWRRSTRHRRGWLAAFVTGLVITLATVIGLGVGQLGGSSGSGSQVGPAMEVIPTPSPGSAGTSLRP